MDDALIDALVPLRRAGRVRMCSSPTARSPRKEPGGACRSSRFASRSPFIWDPRCHTKLPLNFFTLPAIRDCLHLVVVGNVRYSAEAVSAWLNSEHQWAHETIHFEVAYDGVPVPDLVCRLEQLESMICMALSYVEFVQ